MTATAIHIPPGMVDIPRLIPHHGSMCLLAQVQHYDTQSICCTATSHNLQNNPLRESGMLHAVCGIEYAAQAMAVHGALISGQSSKPPRGGRLASVRSVEFSVTRLDTIDEDIVIQATLLMGDENSMVYEFSVHASTRDLLKGKATIVLMPGHTTESTA